LYLASEFKHNNYRAVYSGTGGPRSVEFVTGTKQYMYTLIEIVKCFYEAPNLWRYEAPKHAVKSWA